MADIWKKINVFIERLWRLVNYERVYLHSHDSIADLRAGLIAYFSFANQGRTHQSLAKWTPDEPARVRER